MGKKKALYRDMAREVWRTKNRFLSIFAIVAIGCGFFAGIKITCPDMKATAADYFSSHNLYDLKVMTNYGLTEENIEALRALDGVKAVMPGYSADLFAKDEDNSVVVRIYSYDHTLSGDGAINQPKLLEGRMPEKAGECVVENNYHTPSSFKVGGTVSLSAPEDGGAVSDTLSTDQLTIVGIIESPMYLSIDRGLTTIGNGTVNSYLYADKDTFTGTVYTEAYITLTGSDGLSPYEDGYKDLTAKMEEELKTIAPGMARARYQEVTAEAADKIAEGEQKTADGEKDIEKAKSELADAEKELEDGEQAWIDARNEAETSLANGFAALSQKETELNAAQSEITAQRAPLESALAQVNGGLSQLAAQQTLLDGQVSGLNAAAAARTLLQSLQALVGSGVLSPLSPEQQALVAASASIDPALPTLLTAYFDTGDAAAKGAAQGALSAALAALPSDADIQSGLMAAAEAQSQITAQKTQLDSQKAQIEAGLQSLNAYQSQITDGMAQLASARATLESSKQEAYNQLDENRQKLLAARTTFEREKKEALQKITDAETDLAKGKADLADAKTKLADLAAPESYVLDRNNDAGYASFAQDAERIDAISVVFPIFFILVAALVCLTTMTRMVEEQRTQIGTVKALGYSEFDIVIKYLLYAAAASTLGALAGTAVGLVLFPIVIYNAYTMMYTTPSLIIQLPPLYFAGCVGVSVISTCAAAFAACYKELLSQPAALMRPKAPPAGKRVLLEKIPFIWNKFSFIQKVTARNLFRYKKRVLLTVVGIAGCTALMLAGFGIRDSISVIVDKQYGEIFVNDAVTLLDTKATTEEVANVRELISQEDIITAAEWAKQASVTAKTGDTKVDAYLMVFEKPDEIQQVIKLHNRQTGNVISLSDDSVVVSEKMAKLLGLSVGDTFTASGTDLPDMQLKVGAITENYAYHYIYMTPAAYRAATGADPFYNAAYLNFSKTSDDTARTAYAETMLKQGGVLATTFSKDGTKTFQDIVNSLNMIVIVLIVSAGALAFVVLYNLTNINVTERIRELATIKVLGFYDGEVAAYVYRENMVCSFLGILFGLGLGVILHRFVIYTAEVDMVMFSRQITLFSFVIAAVLTFAFTLVVNFVLYFTLKKIDMVISLKSTE